jgi:hypothetical protein
MADFAEEGSASRVFHPEAKRALIVLESQYYEKLKEPK